MSRPTTSRPETLYTPDAIARATSLATAYTSTLNTTDHGDVAAKVEAILTDVGADVEELRNLVASLAGIAGHAIQTASYLRLAAGGLQLNGSTQEALNAFEEQRAAVLYECAESLHELRRAKLPWALPQALSDVDDDDDAPAERRSGIERRTALNRRRYAADSPPARVNHWLHGERRSGKDRRGGADRRRSASRDEG